MELMIESSNRELKESSSRVDEEKGRDWYREEPSFIPLVLTVVQRVHKALKLWPYQCFGHLVVVDYALFKSPVNKTEFAENLCRYEPEYIAQRIHTYLQPYPGSQLLRRKAACTERR